MANQFPKLDLQALQGMSTETRVALLASAYSTLAGGMEDMMAKMDDFIEEANKKKGAAALWNKITNIVIGLIGGGGGVWGIMSSAKSAAATVADHAPSIAQAIQPNGVTH